MVPDVDPAATLRETRLRAGLSQAALAARAGTSQAAISAYESGRKAPSVQTLSRLLAAMGHRLGVEAGGVDHARTAAALLDVLDLAAALPVRHRHALSYPRLDAQPR